MKRRLILVLCLLVAALLTLDALAETAPRRTLYADQGGVRVFAENGLAGLADAEGNVLLPAEYDAIEPFGDSDFARTRRRYKYGVVRRDGSMAAACRWDNVEIHGAWRLAECYANDGDTHALIDLQSGETRWSGGWPPLVDDDYVYALTSFGRLGFGGPEPPYHTDVYDRDWNVALEVDGWFETGFEAGRALVLGSDGAYRVIGPDGRALADGFEGHVWGEGGRFFYDRRVHNPLNRLLKPLQLDRRHMAYDLSLLGVRREGRWATALLNLYEDGSRCGIIEADGRRVEAIGTRIVGPDEAGLYRVNAGGRWWAAGEADRWGYVDADGAAVIDAAYDEAGPFVDGAAAVRKGRRWFLIDARGERVGDITWKRADWGWHEMWSQLPLMPVGNPKDGVRVVDRRGEYVTDEVFSEALGVYAGKYLVLRDGFGDWDDERHVCLVDMGGGVALRTGATDADWTLDAPGAIWLLDGLWGLMALEGEDAGTWRVEPQYLYVDGAEDGGYRVGLADGTAAYIDASGALLGPARGRATDF